MSFLKHPRNDHIKFIEEGHKYWYYPSGDKRKTTERVQFNGITSWISEFCSTFNTDKVAKACNKNPNSKWYDMGVENIKQAWKDKGQESLDYGNAIHNGVETFINTGEIVEDWEDYVERFDDLMLENNLKPVASEFVIYDEDLKRATAIDIVALNTDTDMIVPLDIKTFKDGMEYSSYKGKTMKYPLGDLQESKFDKVSLQIAIERHFLKNKYDQKTETGFCVLLNDDECKLLPVRDYMDCVDEMIEF